MEPEGPPKAIAILPETTKPVATATTVANTENATPATTQEGSNATTPSSTPPPEQPPGNEPPTVAGLLAFMQPLLSKGISIEKLRWQVGHAKGKEWTVLNRIIASIQNHKQQRVATKDLYKMLQNEFQSSCGAMVNAMSALHLSDEGRLQDAWEKEILYSNLRTRKKASTKSSDTDSKTVATDSGAGSKGSTGEGSNGGEFDIDEALKYIELRISPVTRHLNRTLRRSSQTLFTTGSWQPTNMRNTPDKAGSILGGYRQR